MYLIVGLVDMEIVTLKELGKLARHLRKEAGLSQAEVAEYVASEGEVAQNHISLAEQGHPKYTSLAMRIVEELGKANVEPVYRIELLQHSANND